MWRAEDILGLFRRSQKQTSQELVDDGVQRTCIVRASVFAASVARRFKPCMNSKSFHGGKTAEFAWDYDFLCSFAIVVSSGLFGWLRLANSLSFLSSCSSLVFLASLVSFSQLALSNLICFPWLPWLSPCDFLFFLVSLAYWPCWLS
jgi:hypothetical protein